MFYNSELIRGLKVKKKLIQPSSLDVQVAKNYFLPKNQTVKVEIKEWIPNQVANYSARSSLARCGVDSVFNGQDLYLTSRAFDVKIYRGQRIGQFMFSDVKSEEIKPIFSKELFLDTFAGLMVAKPAAPVLHFEKKANWRDYFQHFSCHHSFNLHPEFFYLAMTNHKVGISDDRVGLLQKRTDLFEGIVHTGAGLFDSGFVGKPVLEIIPDKSLSVQSKQAIGQMDFYNLTGKTDISYKGHYQGQDSILNAVPWFLQDSKDGIIGKIIEKIKGVLK